jgi:hypothetical protein
MSLNHTTWRTHPHAIDVYCYVHIPDVVFECGVDLPSFNYPLVAITYDDVTIGAYTDVRIDMTFRIVASDGTIRGYGRIRKAATSDTLYINRVSEGELYMTGTDRIEVLDDYRIWSKLPYIDPNTGQIFKDYDMEYTDEGYYPPPIINCGPGCGIHTPQNLAVVPFSYAYPTSYTWGAGASHNIDPDAFDFDYADGALFGGSPANGSADIGFLGGFRWVHITGYETGSDKSWTRHVPVVVTSNSFPPTPVTIKSLRGAPDGWRVEFDILDADIAAAVPDGALVMIWAAERYGSAEGSLTGYSDREQMLFVGWLAEERSVFDEALSEAEFVAVGPLGKLRELPMMSQNTSRNGTSFLASYILENTLFRHLCYLLMWHSTILNLCDLEEPDWAGDYPIVSLNSGQEGGVSNLFDAVNGRPGADSIGARFTCDHAGRMYLREDPVLMRVEDRQNVTIDVALQSSDWMGKIAIRRSHQLPVAWLRASAILANGSEITPLLAVAPGDNPSQGGREERYDQLLAQSSDDFIRRVGRQYGRLNNPILPFPMDIINGGLVADPAWMHYVSIDLDASSNKRGISFDPTLTPQQTKAVSRFALQSVDITFDHEIGAMSQTWTLEPDNSGFRAKLENVPTGDVDRAPSQPAKGVITYNPTTTPEGSGVVVAADLSTLRRTANWSAATPTWVEKFDPDDWITGGTLTIKDFAMDPYDPGEGCLVAVHDSDGYLHIARLTQLTNDSPVCAINKSIAIVDTDPDSVQVFLRPHTGQAGKFLLLIFDSGDVNTYATTDYFGTVDTWTCPDTWPGFGTMDASIYTDDIWVAGRSGILYHSTNWGVSYSTVDISDETAVFGGTASNWGFNMMHLPPYNNADSDNLIVLVIDSVSADGAVGKTENTGTDWANITPSYSGDDYRFDLVPVHYMPLSPIATSWSDHDKIYAALLRAARDVTRLFVYDGSWSMKSDISTYQPYIISVWPGDDTVVFGVCDEYLIYSEDEGENWAAKQWSGFSGGVGIWVGSIG